MRSRHGRYKSEKRSIKRKKVKRVSGKGVFLLAKIIQARAKR
jgi:hypothetical protein